MPEPARAALNLAGLRNAALERTGLRVKRHRRCPITGNDVDAALADHEIVPPDVVGIAGTVLHLDDSSDPLEGTPGNLMKWIPPRAAPAAVPSPYADYRSPGTQAPAAALAVDDVHEQPGAGAGAGGAACRRDCRRAGVSCSPAASGL